MWRYSKYEFVWAIISLSTTNVFSLSYFFEVENRKYPPGAKSREYGRWESKLSKFCHSDFACEYPLMSWGRAFSSWPNAIVFPSHSYSFFLKVFNVDYIEYMPRKWPHDFVGWWILAFFSSNLPGKKHCFYCCSLSGVLWIHFEQR